MRKVRCSSPAQSQTNGLQNWYFALPSLALGIIRIGKYLIGSVLGWNDWVENWVMVLVAGLRVGQHYKDIMSAHCHKSVSTRPDMILNLPGCKPAILSKGDHDFPMMTSVCFAVYKQL